MSEEKRWEEYLKELREQPYQRWHSNPSPTIHIGTINIFEGEEHSHHKRFKTYVSSITINNNTTKGIIMATTFKKSEAVKYTIVFTDAGENIAPVSAFFILSSSGIVNVVPDTPSSSTPAATYTGQINGVDDGDVTVNWGGTSAGGKVITGSITLTVADAPPVLEATNTTIQLSAAFPQ